VNQPVTVGIHYDAGEDDSVFLLHENAKLSAPGGILETTAAF
jgi:hypothetical protein